MDRQYLAAFIVTVQVLITAIRFGFYYIDGIEDSTLHHLTYSPIAIGLLVFFKANGFVL